MATTMTPTRATAVNRPFIKLPGSHPFSKNLFHRRETRPVLKPIQQSQGAISITSATPPSPKHGRKISETTTNHSQSTNRSILSDVTNKRSPFSSPSKALASSLAQTLQHTTTTATPDVNATVQPSTKGRPTHSAAQSAKRKQRQREYLQQKKLKSQTI
jgi:hypothetical protein